MEGLFIYFEYFCNNCLQLRLCCDTPARSECKACNSRNIVKGPIGTLNKEKLKQLADGRDGGWIKEKEVTKR